MKNNECNYEVLFKHCSWLIENTFLQTGTSATKLLHGGATSGATPVRFQWHIMAAPVDKRQLQSLYVVIGEYIKVKGAE